MRRQMTLQQRDFMSTAYEEEKEAATKLLNGSFDDFVETFIEREEMRVAVEKHRWQEKEDQIQQKNEDRIKEIVGRHESELSLAKATAWLALAFGAFSALIIMMAF